MMRLVVAILAVAAPTAAWAQEGLITLDTDKETYHSGDVLVLFGQVATILPGEHMRMQIQFQGSVMEIAQFDVAEDGSYTYMVRTEGANWKNDGEYALRLWYGRENVGKTFVFEGGDLGRDVDIFEVADGRGGTFDVGYAVRGGTVNAVEVDQRNLAILVELDAATDGELLLELPRAYINATDGESDVPYIVLVDGIQREHTDDMGPDKRQVVVGFPRNTTQVMVIGTAVVPEFGTAVMALAAALAATTILASRFRTGTFP